MDSLICANHPDSAPETGYVHACGHHAQCAALLGIAAAVRDPEIAKHLSGKVRFLAVPAEELLELGYREELRKQGVIRYFGGKVEFLYRGYLDGIDAAFMVHTAAYDRMIGFPVGSNGCLSKNITFHGKSAHAGGAPEHGINALYAANLGLSAINALRETFVDDDHIRVHPILTSGGTAVNAIPETVTMESYVRGASLDSISAANEKVNRALAASALAMGANVEISDLMGYFPLNPDEELTELGFSVASALFGEGQVVRETRWGTGCTDMGDIASVLPALHPYVAEGQGAGPRGGLRHRRPRKGGRRLGQVPTGALVRAVGGRRAARLCREGTCQTAVFQLRGILRRGRRARDAQDGHPICGGRPGRGRLEIRRARRANRHAAKMR